MGDRIMEIKDSGKRQDFPTGSVRDTREGKGRFDLISPFALEQLAKWYELGATKYGDRNWEKGQPFSRFYDSTMRHLNKHLQGQTDEPHLLAAIWNLFCIVHGERMIELGLWPKELNDLPNYLKGEKMDTDYKTSAYLAAPVRGKLGDAVEPKKKWDNVRAAMQLGYAIRQAFPSLDLFVPHEHEVIIDQLWRNGLPSDDVVTATSQIAAARDFMIVYDGDGISAGMAREIDVVSKAGKPIVYFDLFDEEAREAIAKVMSELKGK